MIVSPTDEEKKQNKERLKFLAKKKDRTTEEEIEYRLRRPFKFPKANKHGDRLICLRTFVE